MLTLTSQVLLSGNLKNEKLELIRAARSNNSFNPTPRWHGFQGASFHVAWVPALYAG